jgi:hypothetical protein
MRHNDSMALEDFIVTKLQVKSILANRPNEIICSLSGVSIAAVHDK